MGAKIVIKNPFLNAVTYHYCYNMPTETLKTLGIKYRRMLSSQARTKAWCEKSSIDEKLHFFNAIGLNCGLTVFPDKVKSGASLKEILRKYDEEKRAAAQKDQANLGFYVTTDRDTAYLLGNMSMTINHQSYIRALDYNKTGYSIKNWSKVLDSPGQAQTLEVLENTKVVSDTILQAGLAFGVVTQLFEVNECQLKILMFMYQRRQSYVFRDDIVAYFYGYESKTRMARAIKKLILSDYLEKHQDWQTYQYRISSKGIVVVSEFVNRVLKQSQF